MSTYRTLISALLLTALVASAPALAMDPIDPVNDPIADTQDPRPSLLELLYFYWARVSGVRAERHSIAR